MEVGSVYLTRIESTIFEVQVVDDKGPIFVELPGEVVPMLSSLESRGYPLIVFDLPPGIL